MKNFLFLAHQLRFIVPYLFGKLIKFYYYTKHILHFLIYHYDSLLFLL